MRINQETGCIFDTLTFLSAWIGEITKKESANANNVLADYYHDAKQSIMKNTKLPCYLYPFLCRHGDNESFLFHLFFESKYSKCNFDTLNHTLNNKSYIKRKFISFHIPTANDQAVNNVIKMDNPDSVIEVLAQRSTDKDTDTYLFYILSNFDEVIETLHDVVHSVCMQMYSLRQLLLPDLCAKALKKETVYDKLKAITSANALNESSFTVSVSLMNPDLFSYRTGERNFILLGYDFEKRLDSEYRYIDISLYSFAQAIASNPLKYDIFTALYNESPLTAADISMRLNASRASLDYNLSEMVKSRIIITEQINKRTYNYRINDEYLQIIACKLSAFTNK